MIKRVVSVFIVMFLFINLVLINSVQAYTNIKKNEDDFIVCIDPGHQGKGDSRGEQLLQIQVILSQEFLQELLE